MGLRAHHYPHILSHLPPVPWFEALTENYMAKGGMSLMRLRQIRNHYPIVFHGVGMSLGSTDPMNLNYLKHLKHLIKEFQPAYVSDHLSWTSLGGEYVHELLPLPYHEEAVTHVSERIKQVQDQLQQQILIENVSSYLQFSTSDLTEWEFLSSVAEQADCFILLDINNIYVNAHNHGFDPQQYLKAINPKRVREIHLAGYLDCKTHWLDNHGTSVSEPVWELYREALQRFGNIPTCIEWDSHIPAFSKLMQEVLRAKAYQQQNMAGCEA